MRSLAVMALLSLGLCGIAAEIPAQRGARAVRARDAAKPAADPRVNAAGLRLVSFDSSPEGWVSVTVSNTTSSEVSFDYHQLQALVYQTSEIAEGGDIRFRKEEIASYGVPAGATKKFSVLFTIRRRAAAVRWKTSDDWLGWGGRIYSTTDALGAFRQMLIEARTKEQRRSLVPVVQK